MKYGVISDIHSDIKSLNVVLNKFKELKVKHIYCCGDIVGYGDFPNAVIKAIRKNNIICVAGNHEKALFFEEDYLDMNPIAKKAIDNNFDLIDNSYLNYLESLPNYITKDNMRFVHGLPPDCYSNYLNKLDNEEIKGLFKLYSEQIAFCGHTHCTKFVEYGNNHSYIENKIEIKKTYNIERGKRYIINVGSVSLPRDKGHKGHQFVVFDSVKKNVLFYEI